MLRYWWQWALIISGLVTLALNVLALGIWIGHKFGDVHSWLIKLQGEVDDLQAPEDVDDSAVIETTPQLIEKKRRQGRLNDDESAIITVKSPRQVAIEKDRKLQEELDKLSG